MSFARPVLFAVHLADGVASPTVLLAGAGLAAAVVGYSAWGVEDDEVPRVGVLTAAFFVASQFHLPLGVTSAHLLLNGLAAVVIGRRAGLAVAVGLVLQSFLFAHGGLTAVGVNVCVLAGPAVLAGVLFRPARRARVLPDFWLGFLFGAGTAAATVGLNFLVLRYGAADDLGWGPWAALVANLPVVGVEAVGVGFAVRYLGKVKPEWMM